MFNAKSITEVKSKHQRRKINRCISEKNNYFPCNFYAQHGKNYMQSASDFLLTTLTINDTTAPIVIERKTWHPGIFFELVNICEKKKKSVWVWHIVREELTKILFLFEWRFHWMFVCNISLSAGEQCQAPLSNGLNAK